MWLLPSELVEEVVDSSPVAPVTRSLAVVPGCWHIVPRPPAFGEVPSVVGPVLRSARKLHDLRGSSPLPSAWAGRSLRPRAASRCAFQARYPMTATVGGELARSGHRGGDSADQASRGRKVLPALRISADLLELLHRQPRRRWAPLVRHRPNRYSDQSVRNRVL